MYRAFIGWLSRLDDRGGIALLTAICAPVLLLIAGFAVDYGYALYLNQRLAQATDNAVIGSVSQSAATAGGGFSNTAWLQAYGQQVFNANIANLPISGVTFNLQVTSNGTGGVNSVGSYSYNYPTFFAGILGISQIPLSSQIKAAANPITYIDYYIVIDISQSMGIGATTADMNALWTKGLTAGAGAFGEQSCVFGCHVKDPTQNGPSTNEAIAHGASPPITLRIDSAVQAVQNIIKLAQQNSGTNKNIRVGIYTITRDPSNMSQSYSVISSPSADYQTLIGLAGAIDLGNNTPEKGDTDFATSLSAIGSGQLPSTNGSGASAVSPKNYIFLVTDGLYDEGSLASCLNSNTCTKPIGATDCNPLKSKATVGVIYTTYNPIYYNNSSSQGLEPLFKSFVAPYLTFDGSGHVIDDQMADNLKSCSSDASKFYFPAVDGPAINSAMQQLFASTLQNARLTQ